MVTLVPQRNILKYEERYRPAVGMNVLLTLKAPITTAADDKFWDIFANFRQKLGMILYENRLPADDSHEIRGLSKKFIEFVNKSKSTSVVAFKLSHV